MGTAPWLSKLDAPPEKECPLDFQNLTYPTKKWLSSNFLNIRLPLILFPLEMWIITEKSNLNIEMI